MSSKPNNPLAFPSEIGHGMTLRDYFAARAMQGLIECTGHDTQSIALLQTSISEGKSHDEVLAQRAWDMADAMLAAAGGGE